MNKLNRSLEAVITVGNEFSGVEALWSQFENVMGDQASTSKDDAEGGKSGGLDGQGEGDTVDGDGSTVLTEDDTVVTDVVGGRGGERRR